MIMFMVELKILVQLISGVLLAFFLTFVVLGSDKIEAISSDDIPLVEKTYAMKDYSNKITVFTVDDKIECVAAVSSNLSATNKKKIDAISCVKK